MDTTIYLQGTEFRPHFHIKLWRGQTTLKTRPLQEKDTQKKRPDERQRLKAEEREEGEKSWVS